MSVDIEWRIALASPPQRLWWFLATDEGRMRFLAERSEARGDCIDLLFPNGEREAARIEESVAPMRLVLRYFGARTVFSLTSDGSGSILTLRAEAVPAAEACTVEAGWVSVLLALKAAADFSVDLRNHDRAKTWDERYCDN